MKNLLIVAAMLFSLAACAQEAPGKEVSTETVHYGSGNETVQAIRFWPTAMMGKPMPAVIVIHEWWGLNDWVKQMAGKLAGEGYQTLAIDLYRGRTATTPDEAHELMRGLPDDRALRDLKAAYDYLAARQDVDKARIGAIGWCMGGGEAAKLAASEPRLRAVAINYGSVPADETSLVDWKAATLGLFGGKDRGITPASAQSFAATMKKLGRDVDVHIYPDAGHAFENPNNQAGYRADDAADAWRRITAFFAAKLK